MVSAGTASFAHAARRYRLRVHRGADDLWRDRRQSMAVQGRDSGLQVAPLGIVIGAGAAPHGTTARPGSRPRSPTRTATGGRRTGWSGDAIRVVRFAASGAFRRPADAATHGAAAILEAGSTHRNPSGTAGDRTRRRRAGTARNQAGTGEKLARHVNAEKSQIPQA